MFAEEYKLPCYHLLIRSLWLWQ
uniref:Uncharacterized protein n=1 Tax=Arundo donax TaxID=35708 RepID=A0A0A9AEC1_ARUDO